MKQELTQKEIDILANDLYNNKITIEDVILNYSIEVAGEVYDNLYKISSNSKNGLFSAINSNILNISVNGQDQNFYKKVLNYIRTVSTNPEKVNRNSSLTILFNIINSLSDEYNEKITSNIFDLVEPYLEKIILSKGKDKDSYNEMNLILINVPETYLSFEKIVKLFKKFFKNKNIEDVFYISRYLSNFAIYDFTLIIDIEKFNNPEQIFSSFSSKDQQYTDDNYYKFYNTFVGLIDKNDEFVKNSILTKQDIFKFIFKKTLDTSSMYAYNPLDPSIKSRVDRVIKIIKETLGEEKGKEYIKKNLFKSFRQSDVRYMISAFPFKDYKEYIPDTKVGKEIKNLLNLNSNKLSEADIKNIKKLPVPEQNKFLSNPNVSMDIVKEIIGKRYVSKELLNLVKERRPGDYLEFCKLKARQYLINSMKDELTDLKDMGLIEDVIVDFKIPEGQEDSLNLYLNLK